MHFSGQARTEASVFKAAAHCTTMSPVGGRMVFMARMPSAGIGPAAGLFVASDRRWFVWAAGNHDAIIRFEAVAKRQNLFHSSPKRQRGNAVGFRKVDGGFPRWCFGL